MFNGNGKRTRDEDDEDVAQLPDQKVRGFCDSPGRTYLADRT